MINRKSAQWRQCARKSRRLADQSSDPIVRNTMLDIALSYERLAIHAEAARGRQTTIAAKALEQAA